MSVLILNCMQDDGLGDSFNRAITRPISQNGMTVNYLRMSRMDSFEMPHIDEYSHFIISGSEASTTDDNPWDKPLIEIIQQINRLKKPLLGICYGHQFLARALAGKGYTRQSPTPEFGWTEIKLSESCPLFEGISNPGSGFISMVSHYDEAFNLPADFHILATSSRCSIHAFQYRDLPVYGLQFHPEYHIEEADEIFNRKKTDPKFLNAFIDRREEAKMNLIQNQEILLNFLTRIK